MNAFYTIQKREAIRIYSFFLRFHLFIYFNPLRFPEERRLQPHPPKAGGAYLTDIYFSGFTFKTGVMVFKSVHRVPGPE